MIKMAQLEDIRKMYFMEGLSIREITAGLGYTGIQSQNIFLWRNPNRLSTN
jgi:hypothetical protein